MAQITPEDIQERLHDHVYMSYVNYAFFIKGAVIAVASIALIFLLEDRNAPCYWVRWLLWAASFNYTLVTIATWARGSAFTNARASFADIICPITMGVCEVSMFAVIPVVDKNVNDAWIYWFLLFAVHAFMAAWLVSNRIALATEQDYHLDLQDKLLDYKKWLRADLVPAAALGVSSFFVFAGSLAIQTIFKNEIDIGSVYAQAVYGLIVIIYTGIALKVTLSAIAQYNDLAGFRKTPAR